MNITLPSFSQSIFKPHYLSKDVLNPSSKDFKSNVPSYLRGFKKYDYPFQYNHVNCLLKLGECIGIGCDGAVWSAHAICSNGSSYSLGLKIYKNETDFTDKNFKIDQYLQEIFQSKKFSSISITQHLAYTIGRIFLPVYHLKKSTGKCPIILTSHGSQCPGKLHPGLWKNPQKKIIASIMPYGGVNLRQAYKNIFYRSYAPTILRGIAQGLFWMYQSQIIHCDIRFVHQTIVFDSINQHFTGRIIDFGRMKFCSQLDESCWIGYQLQSLQFVSIVLDFCRSYKQSEFKYHKIGYAFNGGPCGRFPKYQIDQLKKYNIYKIYQNHWHNVFQPRINEGPIGCLRIWEPYLRKIIKLAYEPIQLNHTVQWQKIIQIFDKMIQLGKNESKTTSLL